MKKCTGGIIGAVILGLLGAGHAAADTVVLRSGERMPGQVRVMRDGLRVENEDGVFTISRALVREVISGSAQGLPAAPTTVSEGNPVGGELPLEGDLAQSVPGGGEPARARRVNPGPAGEGAGSSLNLLATLEAPISVDFRDTPLVEVITYIQEVTGANFAYSYTELREDSVLISLKLDQVPLRQVLDLALAGTGLEWGVAGDVVRIGRDLGAQMLQVRTYDVRDLLLNTEDKEPLGGRRFGRSGSRFDTDVTSARYGWDDRRDRRSYYGDDYYGDYYYGDRGRDRGSWRGRRGYGRATSQALNERAYDLAMLIATTVRPETWSDPPVLYSGELGGARRERRRYGEERYGYDYDYGYERLW